MWTIDVRLAPTQKMIRMLCDDRTKVTLSGISAGVRDLRRGQCVTVTYESRGAFVLKDGVPTGEVVEDTLRYATEIVVLDTLEEPKRQ
jgi:hypothetical protein